MPKGFSGILKDIDDAGWLYALIPRKVFYRERKNEHLTECDTCKLCFSPTS